MEHRFGNLAAFGVAWLLVSLVPAARADDRSLQADQQRLERLDRQLAILRREAGKSRSGAHFRSVEEDARALREEALRPLEEFDGLDGLLASVQLGLEGVKHRAGDLETRGLRTLFDRTAPGTARRIAGADVALAATKLAKDVGDLAGEIDEARRAPSLTPTLDSTIRKLEATRTAVGTNDAIGVVNPVVQKACESVLGMSLAVLNAYGAGRRLDDRVAREAYLQKAYKEFRDGSASLLAAGGGTGAVAGAQVAVLGAGADALWRIGYYLTARKFASGLTHEAEEIRSRTNNLLLQRILVADYERDKVVARLERARRAKEPGGIKLSGLIADELAVGLDLEAVRFDPVTRSVTLSGRRSSHDFGLDLFCEALRLAREVHEPFFSLEPVDAGAWDRMPSRAYDHLARKYLSTAAGRRRLARRARAVGRPAPGTGVTAVCLEDLDREIWESLVRQLDAREELVFSPDWLVSTRLGWILYRADLAIKAVVAGYVQGETEANVAGVWSIPGFEPTWLHAHPGAGRANFELARSHVVTRGDTLDLSAVAPALVIVHRTPGTHEDLPPCERCTRFTRHFSDHWSEFADRVPEIGALMTVFRAYVAARFLLKRHPGLVAFVDTLARPPAREPVPLYRIDPVVLRVRSDGDALEPLGPDRPALVGLAYGFSGGVSVSSGRLALVPAATPEEGGTVACEPVLEAVRATPAGLAIRLDLAGPGLERSLQLRLWALLVAVAGILLFAGSVRPLGAWLGGGGLDPVCPRCRTVHRTAELVGWASDAVAAGSALFLAILPAAVAWTSEGPDPARLQGYALAVAALLVTARILLGALEARGEPSRHGRPGSGWCGTFAVLARWLALALAPWLLAGGPGVTAVAGRFVGLAGRSIGEPLLLALGDPAPAVWAFLVATGAGLISVIARLVVPFVFLSRPLWWPRLACSRHA